MKINIFKTALMVMTMTVINNAAIAANMNNMPNEASMSVSSSVVAHTTSSTYVANESHGVDAATAERVKPQSTDVYTYRFYAGKEVVIGVKGDGDTDLDLYIYDENKNLIDYDIDDGDLCLCRFTPRWTGQFTIKVKNLGYIYNEYRIRFVQ